ncbi:hypothetical protein XocUg1_23635, partial [Xanthomonas oryzae pv. oryzicola]|nr:hypothetical protein [Xanthomonas oryzae pv. oryzicola]
HDVRTCARDGVEHGGGQDLAVVVADGRSALAVHRPPPARMLDHIDALALQEGWSRKGAWRFGDEVGELL